jgi:hypothetical protein
MSHLHILTEAQTEAINGGFLDTATNLAFMPQTNTLVAVPVATGGGVGLLGLATGGVAGVFSRQRNAGVILQSAIA